MAGTIVYLVIAAAIGTVNALKGKWWMIIFSFGLIGIITAIRVAKPGRFTKHRDTIAPADDASVGSGA
jgi:cell division protein FtsW (lipid II flippase)